MTQRPYGTLRTSTKVIAIVGLVSWLTGGTLTVLTEPSNYGAPPWALIVGGIIGLLAYFIVGMDLVDEDWRP